MIAMFICAAPSFRKKAQRARNTSRRAERRFILNTPGSQHCGPGIPLAMKMAQFRFFLAVGNLRAEIAPAKPLQPVAFQFIAVNEKKEPGKDCEHGRNLGGAGMGERSKADLESDIDRKGKPEPVPGEEEWRQHKSEKRQSVPQEKRLAGIAVGRKICAVKCHRLLIATAARPHKAQPPPVQALSVPLVEGMAIGWRGSVSIAALNARATALKQVSAM